MPIMSPKVSCAMNDSRYVIEVAKPFAESLIWDLNRSYYHTEGLKGWREGTVPHHLTSNALVGKTYAELIFGFLKDLAKQGQVLETVYILELGAGHGRLAFHVLTYLDKLLQYADIPLPKYCFVLSDIIEDSLNFFLHHPQFQTYFERGVLDVAYFDAVASTKLELILANKTITANTLEQPIVAIANYFFDSIPTDLFYLKNKEISACSLSLESASNPNEMDISTLISSLETNYEYQTLKMPFYENDAFNKILADYQNTLFDTYLFFPKQGLECLSNIQQLSQKGLMLISMDKGFREIYELENIKVPDMVTHGSLSFWVNFHALGAFCTQQGGKSLFTKFSNTHMELACLLFVEDSPSYFNTNLAYERFVNDFGPDDFNGIKKFVYKNMAKMELDELIGFLKLSHYDSTFFKNVLYRFKQLSTRVSFKQRKRLGQTMQEAWNNYFYIGESFDLAYELGGIFYDLGFYKDALFFFDASTVRFGEKADVFYNQILCYYQLREDVLFASTLTTASALYPDYPEFDALMALDLNA
jgi:hypothetical protein